MVIGNRSKQAPKEPGLLADDRHLSASLPGLPYWRDAVCSDLRGPAPHGPSLGRAEGPARSLTGTHRPDHSINSAVILV